MMSEINPRNQDHDEINAQRTPLAVIKRFFTAPVFEDDEKTRTAELVNTILVSITLIWVVVVVIALLTSRIQPVQAVAGLATLLILLVLQIPLRRGYVKAVGITIVLTLTLTLAVGTVVIGTVQAPSIVMLILVSIIAGFTISPRAAYWSTAVNILLVSGLVWAEVNKILPSRDHQTNFLLAVIFAVVAVMTAILLNQALKRTQSALELARRNQNELAILNYELEQRVASRTRALETSTEISRRISTILNQRELVREVVEQVQQSFDYYHVHIYLFDETKENLLMVGGTGEAGKTMLERGHKVAKGRGLVGRAGDTGMPVVVPDVSQEAGWLANPNLPGTKAEIAVPIAIGENVLGVLDVQDDELGGLDYTDADLLQSIANQVAIALQNARAYRDAQRQADREALMGNIVQQIQSTTSVEDALKVAVRELGRALEKDTRIRLTTDQK
jgi:putative methionine-R-sulfoxide reductase with GAF domain